MLEGLSANIDAHSADWVTQLPLKYGSNEQWSQAAASSPFGWNGHPAKPSTVTNSRGLTLNVVIAFFCCWPSRIAMSGVSNVSRRTRAFRSDACGLVKISVAEAPFAQVRRSQIRAGSVFTMRLQAARIS